MNTREVVVDAKSSPHAPVDPDVVLPDSVRRAAELAESYYKTEDKPDERQGQAVQERVQVTEVPQTTESASEQAPQTEPARQVEPDQFERPTHPIVDGSWEDKYMAMLGRYQASQRTIGEMQEQMAQLGDELMRTQSMIRQRPQQPPQPQRLVTETDLQNYGPELLDFTQRAAVEAIQPRLAQIQAENERLKRELERSTKRDLSDSLDDAIPNWREIDSSPRWKQWLSLPDLYSGRVRGQLLQDAIRAGEDHRVIGFFRGFLNEEQVTGHSSPPSPLVAAPEPRLPVMDMASLATPGRAARPAPGHDPATGGVAQKPMVTRAQISRFYDDVRKGLYEGRTADYNRDQAEIFAAQREGRIL